MLRPHVVFLTNFIPPYRLPLFRAITCEVGSFRVLESISMPPDRPWTIQHGGLVVETQKTITLKRTQRHPYGFRNQIYVHIPFDTITRLARLRPDVLLTSEIGARTLQALAYRLCHPSSRLVIWAALSEHTERGRGLLRFCLRRMLLPFADAMVVNGKSGAAYIKRFGISDRKIFIAPQATDHVRFCFVPLRREPMERRRFLYVGRLIELKGLASFLLVLSQWCLTHSTEVEFWIIGDGPERGRLQAMSLAANLNVRFFGNVPYKDMPDFYSEAGIFVFPTLSDEWGLVVNEALAAGMPVLGSVYSQAVEELVKEGVNGWTFRPNCGDEMSAALERTMGTSLADLNQMGIAARDSVQHLTPEYVADRIMDAIRFVGGVKGDATPLATISPRSES